MKTLQDRIHGARAAGFEADLEATVNALFRRYPALCGFSVRDVATGSKELEAGQPERDLVLAEVGVYPWPGYAQSGQLLSGIAVALLELMDECPEARELLRGRTFARAIH